MPEPPEIDQDTVAPLFDATETSAVDPPRTLGGTLRYLGPGLIIAASIVGSGELIATTKTGAQAGISLLWLIIIGCLIKVFVQVELGRHAITHGQTTLGALNSVPGPLRYFGIEVRWLRFNWILWFWLAMMLSGMFQLGGIVGGVGQSLAIPFPITGDYLRAIQTPDEKETQWFLEWREKIAKDHDDFTRLSPRERKRVETGVARLTADFAALGTEGDRLLTDTAEGRTRPKAWTWDDRVWATVVALFTVGLLFNGRYSVVQHFSTVLVVIFTFITIGNVLELQKTPQWHIPLSEFVRGLSFQPPEGKGLTTALATFGIIGVGASELVSYPYWCIEKGYARFTGRRSDDPTWAARARGWMRVMLTDAFVSMVIYTFATLAFFLMGVAVLHNEGRDPDGMRMVSTLAAAYVPVFGEYAKWLFLIGAFAVLFSTFLVAIAGHARTYTDAFKVWGLMDRNNQQAHDRSVSALGVALPLLSLATYLAGINPVRAILVAGLMQAILLPMLGFAALYFRRTATDPRLAPSRLWDVMLVISCLGLVVSGTWGVVSALR